MGNPDPSNKSDGVEGKPPWNVPTSPPFVLTWKQREAQASSSQKNSGGATVAGPSTSRAVSPQAPPKVTATAKKDFSRAGNDKDIKFEEPHDRLSKLLLGTSNTGAAQQPKTAPNTFIKNPRGYFWDVKRLQQHIFDFGRDGLGLNVMPHDQFTLPLVDFPSSSGSDTVDMREILSKCHVFGLAIKSGLALTKSTGFLPCTYSILVEDHRRYEVLQLIPVSLMGLETIVDLLEEAMRHCISGYGWLTKVLDDILEASTCIMASLGLPIPAVKPTSESLAGKCGRICRVVYPMLSVLFLGLVSFVTSQTDLESIELHEYPIEDLLIKTSGRTIKMSRKRFRCLHHFVTKPVFAFSTLPYDSPPLVRQRYYLSAFVEDLANLWGPMRLSSGTIPARITTRRGFIGRVPPETDCHCYPKEQTCHWFEWESPEHQLIINYELPIDPFMRLLIGTRTDSSTGWASMPTAVPQQTCGSCQRTSKHTDSYPAFELKAKISSWKLDERTGQMVLGQYFSAVYGQTWKFNAAWTLKDVIVEDWLDAVSENPLHIPTPFYFDYVVILAISSCIGNSRRTSIWELLQSGALQNYLSTVLNPSTCQDLEILVGYFQSTASFTKVWRSITSSAKDMFKGIARILLGILRTTGVGSNGLLQAWDSTSTMRMDGRGLDPCWRNMLQDDLGCATFAIITDVCIEDPQDLEDALNIAEAKKGTKSPTVLGTCLCLNWPAAHTSEDYGQVGFSGTDDSAMDKGRSAGVSFEQWKVASSREHGASPQSRKGLEATLDKIRRRHVFRKRKQESLAASGSMTSNSADGYKLPSPATNELPSSPSSTTNGHRIWF
ncbi:hypothetical protein IFR05_008191 [Cadophora sp. M221]|nr:hypothetical protein IFR05_008191 [Cadophora sp. M221]